MFRVVGRLTWIEPNAKRGAAHRNLPRKYKSPIRLSRGLGAEAMKVGVTLIDSATSRVASPVDPHGRCFCANTRSVGRESILSPARCQMRRFLKTLKNRRHLHTARHQPESGSLRRYRRGFLNVMTIICHTPRLINIARAAEISAASPSSVSPTSLAARLGLPP